MTLGDVLGLLGITFAVYQIWKAERAALAAKRAVEKVGGQVNVYSLLLLIPELALVEQELEQCARGNRKEETARALREWQNRATDLRGLLKELDVSEDELEATVQKSMVSVRQAMSRLAKGNGTPDEATQRARAATTEVVLVARREATRIRAAIPPPEPVPTLKDDVIAAWRWFTRQGGNESV